MQKYAEQYIYIYLYVCVCVCVCVYFIQTLSGRIFWSSKYFFSAILPAMTVVNLTQFSAFLLGSEVKFSLTAFFATQPIPATRPVSMAASREVLTSLLLDDMVYIYIFVKNMN